MNEWTLPAKAAAVYDDWSSARSARGAMKAASPSSAAASGRTSSCATRNPTGCTSACWRCPTGSPPCRSSGRTAALTDHLYRAQANDAYWHGLFGGLYLPHLRREVYCNLLKLEAALDAVAPRPPLAVGDPDFDGVRELFLGNADVQAVVKLDAHAALCELDAYGLAHNFGDVLTQRAEHYYRKLNAAPAAAEEGAGIASAHDRVAFKDADRAGRRRAGCAPAPPVQRCLAPARRRDGLAAVRGRGLQGAADECRLHCAARRRRADEDHHPGRAHAAGRYRCATCRAAASRSNSISPCPAATATRGATSSTTAASPAASARRWTSPCRSD
jgi:hypothetical protein